MRRALTLTLVVALSLVIAPASVAFAGPITREDYAEYACMTIGIKGTKRRQQHCAPMKKCVRDARELRKHSKLVVVKRCTVTSPLWCFELAPRSDLGSTSALLCQPTLASCRSDRASYIKDLGRGDQKDGRCKKMTSVPPPPGRGESRSDRLRAPSLTLLSECRT